jgi:hypothetical protein
MFARQLKCFSGTDRVAPTMKSVDGRIRHIPIEVHSIRRETNQELWGHMRTPTVEHDEAEADPMLMFDAMDRSFLQALKIRDR